MKLELPDDHPLAEAIKRATGDGFQNSRRLYLSLHTVDNNGHIAQVANYEINQWSKERTIETRFECALEDPRVRDEWLRAILKWPSGPVTEQS